MFGSDYELLQIHRQKEIELERAVRTYRGHGRVVPERRRAAPRRLIGAIARVCIRLGRVFSTIGARLDRIA